MSRAKHDLTFAADEEINRGKTEIARQRELAHRRGVAISAANSNPHERRIKMAILTVPAHVAQEVSNVLIEAGILAILNFAPIILQVPDNVVVNNVDLAIELENLSYFIQ